MSQDPPWPRCQIGRATIDCLTPKQAVQLVMRLAEGGGDGRRYVVTPNIQHISLLEDDADLRRAYAGADLVLPDGFPVALAASVLTRNRQPRVAGSDLVVPVCQLAADRGLSVGFLGGQPGAAAKAVARLSQLAPKLVVTLVEVPPLGFEGDAAKIESLLASVRAAGPAVLFVGLGTPKQELFISTHAGKLGEGVVLCVGAAIDFVAGVERRAPKPVQRVGLEWLWRVLREPRRLAGRYARAAPTFLRVAGWPVLQGLWHWMLRHDVD